MLQLNFIRENKDLTIAGLTKRGFKDPEAAVDQLIHLDQQRRETQAELDTTLAQSNALAKQIGGLMKEGKKEEAEAAKAQTAELKAKSRELEEQL
ncbi:MAG: serine--tRNA ligase, partial [Siphonobacter aquaeclarae]|nr:serine--tRNA ligase [Siphonobacter aquaeclarae]